MTSALLTGIWLMIATSLALATVFVHKSYQRAMLRDAQEFQTQWLQEDRNYDSL